MKLNNLHYNFTKNNGYKPFNFIIGERGDGKSTALRVFLEAKKLDENR